MLLMRSCCLKSFFRLRLLLLTGWVPGSSNFLDLVIFACRSQQHLEQVSMHIVVFHHADKEPVIYNVLNNLV